MLLEAGNVGISSRGTFRRDRLISLIQANAAIVVLVILTLGFGGVFPDLLHATNLENIVTAAAFLGFITIGQSYVLILGGFDLSVGSMVGLATVLSAYAAPHGWVAALMVPVMVGFLVGLINGLLISKARMAPFIVTLAMLLGLRGLALALANNALIIDGNAVFTAISNTDILGINSLIWMLAIAFIAASTVLNRTRFGMDIFAVGGNEDAARMFGVRVNRVKIATYCMSGALAGLAGALMASRLHSGLSTAGNGYELQSIAAAVIGGVLLTGGVGTMTGALAGVLLLGLIQNIINQIGTLSAYYQALTSGAFLLVAVVLQGWLSRSRRTG